MTPPVSTELAASALMFAFVVVVARWFLVHDAFGNRLVNRALGWQIGGAAIEVLGSGTYLADVTYRAFLGAGAITLGYLYGIAAVFADADIDKARRRQPIINTVFLVCAVIVVLTGRPADPMQPGFGWQAPLVWAIFNVPMALFGLHVIRACVRELRVAESRVYERLVFSALFLAAAYASFAAVGSGVQVLGGRPSDSPPADWTTASCLCFFVITVLLSVPVVNVLLARAGWDRIGRRCRRLWPLWRDLTAVVPSIVLDDGIDRRDPELRLYRMSVEIQDALQHLKLYMPPADRREQSVGIHAVQIARAVEAKHRGVEPVATVAAGDLPGLITGDRGTELDRLLELARVWPTARAAASADTLVS
ncbi:MAB_1171c family putative transporter [Nocardia sp. CA-128927]|uniref:MAB_1171c family putative transporter n=1 Tax=Nocardia sp. CA-128927 TaxID=3239975 RepID=UPI003D98B93E